MYIARKLTIAKWKNHVDSPLSEIPADAITADLRTHNNSLSFWYCGDSQPAKANLDAAAAAISTAMDRANKVDLIFLERDSLENHGYKIKQTSGDTKIANLAELHFDVCELTYNLLGDMAQRIQQAISKGHIHQVIRSDLLRLLADAANQGTLNPNELKPTLRSEVEARLHQ